MNIIGRNIAKLSRNQVCKHNLCQIGTYKSAISLENLYPNSNLKLSTPQKPQSNDGEKFTGYIPMGQLQIKYSKSTGPGGQNVNKVSTKVDLRFHLDTANWLDEDIKKKLATTMKTRITNDGFLVFRSDITRSQQLNLADCLEKLRTAIREAAQPAPVQSAEAAEKLRRRYEKATIERLIMKRQRSQTKENRRDPTAQDTL